MEHRMSWLILIGIVLAVVNVIVWLYDFFRVREKDLDDDQDDRP
jgi:hypothetical protein